MIPRELQDVLNTKWLKFGRIAFWQRVLTNAVVMIAFTAWTMLDTGPESWDCCGGGSSGSRGGFGSGSVRENQCVGVAAACTIQMRLIVRKKRTLICGSARLQPLSVSHTKLV